MGDTVPLHQNAPRSLSPEDRMHQARAILADLFGFGGFRHGQGEVIRSVLGGGDTLAVMPTGGGKSLCYQIPALVEVRPTIVVSPLLSLMADQVASLASAFGGDPKLAPVAALNSATSPAEKRQVEDGLRSGKLKILLVAPERFRNLEFALMLKRVRPARIVVDEAHCVSEWGHSFRPEYLYLRRVIQDLGDIQTVALTATADPRVRRDIVDLLGMRDPEVLVFGFDRPNLSYEVREVADERKQTKPRRYTAVLDALREGEKPAVVYAHSRRQCETLATFLTRGGIRAEPYHAGRPAAEREEVQTAFMGGELAVVVATIAFGMGVDKPDIRQVIHAYIPASIPAYVQESGRAGRDGAQAHCLVLFSKDEVERRKKLSTRTPLTADDAQAFFDALKEATSAKPASASASAAKLANTERLFMAPRTLASMGGLGSDEAGAVLRNLERVGAVERRYNLWHEARIELIRDPRGVAADGPDDSPLSMLSMSPAVQSVLKVIQRDILANSGKLSIPLTELARRARVTPPVAQGSLMSLATSRVITASGRGTLADISPKVARLSQKDLVKLGALFTEQAGVDALHVGHVEDYTSSSTCRRQRLLDYFGDEQAGLVAPCDGCDVCRESRRKALGNPSGSGASVVARAFEKLSGIFRS